MRIVRLRTAAVVAALLLPAAAAMAQSNPDVESFRNAIRLPPAAAIQHSASQGLGASTQYAITQPPAPAPIPRARPARSDTRCPGAPVVQEIGARQSAANVYLFFGTGSAELTPDAKATLDNLGGVLAEKDFSVDRFRIEGHTDTVGTPGYNLRLSERRALSVVDYLVRRFGISRCRLVPVGVGMSDLLVPTPDQTPEGRNRRVQFVNLGV